jgi:hypothetical protein
MRVAEPGARLGRADDRWTWTTFDPFRNGHQDVGDASPKGSTWPGCQRRQTFLFGFAEELVDVVIHVGIDGSECAVHTRPPSFPGRDADRLPAHGKSPGGYAVVSQRRRLIR